MTKKCRFASAMIGAAVVTAGIGFAPITPAYADTGQGTVTVLAALQRKPSRPDPLRQLIERIESLFHPRQTVAKSQ